MSENHTRTVLVRTAEVADFDFVYHCVNELEETVFTYDVQRHIFLEQLANARSIYLVAACEDKHVGYISCHVQNLLHHGGMIGEIQEMYVVPEYRSKKVGVMLLNELINLAQSMGVLQIEVTSNSKRELAHKFYLRNGFHHTHKKFTCKLKGKINW